MFWIILLIVGGVILVIGLIVFIYLLIISKKEGQEMREDAMRSRERELTERNHPQEDIFDRYR